MYNKKSFYCIVFFLLLFLLLLAAARVLSPQIKDVELSSWGHQPIGIQRFQLQTSNTDIKYYHISGVIDYHPYQSSQFHITADTCLSSLAINDIPVPLYEFTVEQLCNWQTGIDIKLGPYLRNEKNTFRIEVWNSASSARDSFFSIDIYPLWPKALSVAFIATFCAALILVWMKIGIDGKSITILTGAILAYIWHIYDSGYGHYSHDTGGHLEYVLYIIQHLIPPPPDSGWELHQPPLYYYLAAIVGYPSLLLGYADFIVSLRILSLVLFAGFLSFAALTFRKVIRSHFYYLALFLLAFWPIGTTMAGRINNDILLYFFYAAAFYSLVLWYENPLPAFLARSLLLTGLTVATKTNGLLLFPIMGIAIICKCREGTFSIKELFRREVLIALLCAFVFCCSNLGRTAYCNSLHDKTCIQIIQDELNTGLRISNNPYYFASFNYRQFLNPPFFYPFANNLDREYFWNVFLKTSVLGEFEWKSPTLAAELDFTLLLMVLYASINTIWLFYAAAKIPEKLLFHVIAVGIMVAALAAVRIRYPYSCNQDFRYIYPALVPFLIIYGIILDWHQQRSARVYWLGIVLALVFASTSFSFVLLQHS